MKMWRLAPKRLSHRLKNKVVLTETPLAKKTGQCCQLRLYATPVRSSSSNGVGVGKIVLSLVGASLVAGGGAVAYARFDSGFRSWLENKVPFSDWALSLVIGPKQNDEGAKQSQKQLPFMQPSTKEKAIQKESPKKLKEEAPSAAVKTERNESESKSSVSPSKVATMSEASQKNEKETETTQKATEQKKTSSSGSASDEGIKRRMSAQDATSAAENEALEHQVQESVDSLKSVLSLALGAYEGAILSVKKHTDSLQKALDVSENESQSSAFEELNNASSNKSSAVSKAEVNSVKARAAIEKVKNAIQRGRKSKQTSSNEVLIAAEEALNEAIYGLQKAESLLTLAQSEANILNDYVKLVEQGREQFKKELQTLVPEVKVGEKGKKLSEEELNYIIAHAHRRVDQLQKQLTAQQTGEQQRVQRALDTQRQEYEKLVDNDLSIELQRQQRDLEILYQRKLRDLNDDFEQELLQQLRRQAAAHSEHLRDVVQAQQKQLAIDYERRLDGHVSEARHEFQRELAGSLGRLKGLETGLKTRAELDAATVRAQRLWVACQALKHSIHKGKANVASWEEQRKPLSNEVAAISKAAGADDKFVLVVLNAVPSEALNQGVFTEDALKDRFFSVDTACRRVALINEQGGSLFRYALSYLQSLLMVSNFQLPVSEAADEPIAMNALDTFDVLNRARWYIDRDNLEQALRYMNLLKGAPRFVASDWLKETRLLLELRQVADALVARAAATEVQAAQ